MRKSKITEQGYEACGIAAFAKEIETVGDLFA